MPSFLDSNSVSKGNQRPKPFKKGIPGLLAMISGPFYLKFNNSRKMSKLQRIDEENLKQSHFRRHYAGYSYFAAAVHIYPLPGKTIL
jgi:hypothetical protein